VLRVLVTRPEPGASRTARQLVEAGFQPILLPLSQTVGLEGGSGPVPADAAAVAVTSANAIRHAPARLIAAVSALPCHAVGKRTADAARAAGFASVDEGPGDAGALADSMPASLAGRSIVYLCGRVRFPVFERKLAASGIRVHAVETYDTVAVDYSDEAILAALSGEPVDAVLLYSATAAAAMRMLTERAALQPLLERSRFLALSARIAAAFGDSAGDRVRVAAQPDEAALLALLPATV
jgi:uroporphyrinogen-III synthase